LTIFFLSTEWTDAARRIQNRAIDVLRIKEAKAARAAVELLHCALHLNPVDTESWANLMTAYARLEQWEEAAESGRTATQNGNERNFGNWAQLGETLVAFAASKNRQQEPTATTAAVWDEAVDSYREAIRLTKIQPEAAIGGPSKHAAALAGLGGALRQRAASDTDTMASGLLLKEALDWDGDNVMAWSELGLLMASAGEWEAAKVCAAHVLRIQRVEEEDALREAKL
jgi:tetratricopeptide (TPR) repeat protein